MPQPTRRFLCPHCLQFSTALFACPGCWESTLTLSVRLHVGALQACPCCRAALYAEEACERLAYCEHCHRISDASLHHDREVRLIGVLGTPGFRQIRQRLQAKEDGEGPLRLTHARHATYVLDVSTAAPEVNVTGKAHALRHLEAIWLAGAGLEALELGRLVDRFVRQARLSGSQRRALPVLIQEPALPAPALNVLRTRLSSLRYGIEFSELLSTEQHWPCEPLHERLNRPRVITTTCEQDFQTLAGRIPQSRLRYLHAGIAGAEQQGQLTLLVNTQQFSATRQERATTMAEAVNVVWIEQLPPDMPITTYVERLYRLLWRSQGSRRDIRILIGHPEPDDERRALFTESFPNTVWGISPDEILRHRGAG